MALLLALLCGAIETRPKPRDAALLAAIPPVGWVAIHRCLAPLGAESLGLVALTLLALPPLCGGRRGFGLAVLGTALLAAEGGFGQALRMGLLAGAGWLLAGALLRGLEERLSFSRPPTRMRGLPLKLVCAGLTALALMGLNGILG